MGSRGCVVAAATHGAEEATGIVRKATGNGGSRSIRLVSEASEDGGDPAARSTVLSSGHGGEAAASRDKFLQLPEGQRQGIVDFLNSLVLFKQEEEE